MQIPIRVDIATTTLIESEILSKSKEYIYSMEATPSSR